MGTKYIENPSRDVKFVGGIMIPPGEGRHIDESVLPPELGEKEGVAAEAAPAQPSLAEVIAKLLKGSVKTVVAALPSLTGEALDLVETIESSDGTPRATLLTAVAAERLKRASTVVDGGDAEFEAAVEAAYQAQLAKLTAEQLEALGEDGHAQLRAQAELDVQADRGEG